jgi:hypothetical protein
LSLPSSAAAATAALQNTQGCSQLLSIKPSEVEIERTMLINNMNE